MPTMPADFDEYLRRQVQRLADDVDTSGVLEAVQRRTRHRRARRRTQLAALTLVVLVGTGIGTWGLWRVFPTGQQPTAGPTPTTSRTLPQREQTVATVTLGGDLRLVLTATRATADDRATVQIAVQRQAGATWQRLDQRIIGQRNGWSWTALSAPTSICQLAANDANPPRLGISLLLRPSGQCSRVYPFRLQDDRLVAS
jgi:hypothetical protein